MSDPTLRTLREQVKNAWCTVLDVQVVGVTDNFFELGGTSLDVLQVKERLDAELGHAVELIRFFQYPTVAELAAYLHGSGR